MVWYVLVIEAIVFAVLFTSAKTCPSVGEWVKKMWDGMVFTH